MPERSWLCGQCEEQNPPFTEACRNCYAPFSIDAERTVSRLASIRQYNPSGTVTLSGEALTRHVARVDRVFGAVSWFFLFATPLVVAIFVTLLPEKYAQLYSFTGASFWLSYQAGIAVICVVVACAVALDVHILRYQVGNDGSGTKALVRLYFTRETSTSKKVLITLLLSGWLIFIAIFSFMVGLWLAKKYVL